MLVMCLTLLTPISAFADNLANGSSDSSSFITNPYEYPITPDSPQWRNFTQTSQMIEACQVPEDIVENMTTEALLETVLDYPLMVNVLVQNTPEIGYKFLLENELTSELNKGIFLHLITDYLFYNKYLNKFSKQYIYDDYDKSNKVLINRYHVKLLDEVEDKVFFKDGDMKILNFPLIYKLIDEISNLNLNTVKKEVMENRTKWNSYKNII